MVKQTFSFLAPSVQDPRLTGQRFKVVDSTDRDESVFVAINLGPIIAAREPFTKDSDPSRITRRFPTMHTRCLLISIEPCATTPPG